MIDKAYSNNYIDKCIGLISIKAITTSTIKKQSGGKTILEKTKLRKFHFKNLHKQQALVRIQSALCEVACEGNSYGLKIAGPNSC